MARAPITRSTMFDRDAVFAGDIAEAIGRCLDAVPGNNPKAVLIEEVANELARMKFEQADDDGVVRIPKLPAGVLKKFAVEYQQMLDPSTSGLFSLGYEDYAEKHGVVIVPVSREFFAPDVLNGKTVLDCLDGMTAAEAQRSLPRRNNPTTGLVVFDGATAHDMPLVALWFMRQRGIAIGQQDKLQTMLEALPKLARADSRNKVAQLVHQNDEE